MHISCSQYQQQQHHFKLSPHTCVHVQCNSTINTAHLLHWFFVSCESEEFLAFYTPWLVSVYIDWNVHCNVGSFIRANPPTYL